MTSKPSLPPRPQRYGILGLPAIPYGLLDTAVKYLPWLVLVAAFLNGSAAAGLLMHITSAAPGAISPATIFGVFVSLLASVVAAAAFFWLSGKRQLGWILLAAALGLQFLSGLIISGGSSMFSGIIGLFITAYVLMELRSAYTK